MSIPGPVPTPLTPEERRQFLQAWGLTRILAWALCYGAPLAYAAVFAMAVLKGGRVPGPAGAWGHPAVLGALFLSAGAIGGVLLLGPLFREQLRREPTLARAQTVSRQATVVACALLESAAIFGLVAGVLAGPAAAAAVLTLFLVPPLGYPILVPGPQAWLAILEEGRHG